MGKAGSQISAWASAMQSMINSALDAGVSIYKVMEMLSNNTSSKSMYDFSRGTFIRSGPEGVAYAIREYLRIRMESTTKPEERTPGRFMEL